MGSVLFCSRLSNGWIPRWLNSLAGPRSSHQDRPGRALRAPRDAVAAAMDRGNERGLAAVKDGGSRRGRRAKLGDGVQGLAAGAEAAGGCGTLHGTGTEGTAGGVVRKGARVGHVGGRSTAASARSTPVAASMTSASRSIRAFW